MATIEKAVVAATITLNHPSLVGGEAFTILP